MKTAFYIGDHAGDSLSVRAGCYLTRLVQKGRYGDVTHCEAIHDEFSDGAVLIASSSLRDGGVRRKTAYLDPGKWLIADVPQWDVGDSDELFQRTQGQPYDWRGALATCLPGSPQENRWFCNEWVAAPFLQTPAVFGPHHLAAIAFSIGRDVTEEFFGGRQ